MLSDEAQRRIREMFEEKRTAVAKPLAQERRDWEAQSALVALPRGAHFSPVDAGGVALRVDGHAARRQRPRAALSPWRRLQRRARRARIASSPPTLRASPMCGCCSRTTGWRPSIPIRRGLKDALIAYSWLIGAGGRKPEEIVLGGDSAGGGLALSMLLTLREAGAPLPRAAVLLSPWTDLTVSSPSYAKMRKRDPSITQEDLREAGRKYAGNRNPGRPDDVVALCRSPRAAAAPHPRRR